MNSAIHTEWQEYAPTLETYGICYKEEISWLWVNDPNWQRKWLLFISVRTSQTISLLACVLPILRDTAVPFRLIKNAFYQFQLNGAGFGRGEVGKVLTLFPETEELAIRLAGKITPIIDSFNGPTVENTAKLGKNLYACFSELVPTLDNDDSVCQVKLHVPTKIYIPFPSVAKYKPKKRHYRIIGKYYIPFHILYNSAKSVLFQAINIKHFKFEWCVIKLGKPNAADDPRDRDMYDRLLWERQVMTILAGFLLLPQIIDFVKRNDETFLVMEYIEGVPLWAKIAALRSGKPWKDLICSLKISILKYIIQVIEIISRLHSVGIIHRDISPGNFIVTSTDKLAIIDFELSYYAKTDKPNPPFLLGTPGYISPQQLHWLKPKIGDDIYSLGALIFSILTQIHPQALVQEDINKRNTQIAAEIISPELSNVIIKCLQFEPLSRPSICDLAGAIYTYLDQLYAIAPDNKHMQIVSNNNQLV